MSRYGGWRPQSTCRMPMKPSVTRRRLRSTVPLFLPHAIWCSEALRCPRAPPNGCCMPADSSGSESMVVRTAMLDLAAARTILEAAQEYAHMSGFNPLTLVVLDGGGHVIVAEREDGSSFMRFEIARAKAFGALALGVGSRALTQSTNQPCVINA